MQTSFIAYSISPVFFSCGGCAVTVSRCRWFWFHETKRASTNQPSPSSRTQLHSANICKRTKMNKSGDCDSDGSISWEDFFGKPIVLFKNQQGIQWRGKNSIHVYPCSFYTYIFLYKVEEWKGLCSDPSIKPFSSLIPSVR